MTDISADTQENLGTGVLIAPNVAPEGGAAAVTGVEAWVRQNEKNRKKVFEEDPTAKGLLQSDLRRQIEEARRKLRNQTQ